MLASFSTKKSLSKLIENGCFLILAWKQSSLWYLLYRDCWIFQACRCLSNITRLFSFSKKKIKLYKNYNVALILIKGRRLNLLFWLIQLQGNFCQCNLRWNYVSRQSKRFLVVDSEVILLLRLRKFYSKQKTKQLVLFHFSFESVRQQKRKNEAFMLNFTIKKEVGPKVKNVFFLINVFSGRHVEQTAASQVNHN